MFVRRIRSLPSPPPPSSLLRLRAFHSSPTPLADKPSVPIALISKIRSLRPGTPLSLARSALLSSANDVDAALAWIAAQAADTGAAKAKKLEGRAATEGLVGVALLGDGTGGVGVRAAMVELSCETDFVARTDEFRALLEQITRALAFFAEPSTSSTHLTLHPPSSLADTPLVPSPSDASSTSAPFSTIGTSISSTISRLGENISLRRAATLSLDPVLPGSTTHLASTYLHGSTSPASTDTSFQSGSLASLLLCRLPSGGEVDRVDVKSVLRALARQVVAVPTDSVRGSGKGEEEVSKALYEQPIMTMVSSEKLVFGEGATVEQVLEAWSRKRGVEGDLEVMEVQRWEVGGCEAKE